MNTTPRVIAVVGPTASGKTSLAIELAKTLSGEVISADSRQVYRGLDIGTGKATAEEMAGVPHHLIDICDPTAIYTAEDFVRDANAAINDIIARNRTPIIAGGTHFYLELLRGRMQASPVPPNQSFRESLAHYANEELFIMLEARAKARASVIDPHNRRRLVRALEIHEALGHIPESKPQVSPYDWLILGIDRSDGELRERYHTRATEWVARGLLNEVRQVRATVSQERFLELGFEYTLAVELLDKAITETEFLEQFVTKNRQYAKRQRTWLKRDPDITWLTPPWLENALMHTQHFLNQ